MKKLRIAFCGGGTGGHYYPAVAILEELASRVDYELLYFTVKDKIDDRSVEGDFPGVHRVPLDLRGLLRPLYRPENALILYSHLKANGLVLDHLKGFEPDFLFSTGGFVSFPVVKAAHKLGIPIYIHEQNSVAGITNRKMSVYARKVFVAFEETLKQLRIPEKNIILSGNPVRETRKTREDLFDEFKLPKDCKLVVVLGGSLGSSVINNTMEELYSSIDGLGRKLCFIHSTGDVNAAESLKRFSFLRAFPYLERLVDAIAVSDLVISRGGATSIAELQYYGRKGIIIPWPGASENHQFHNARSLERVGLGYVILEDALTPERLLSAIDHMLLMKCDYKPPRRPVEIVLDYILREESI